MLTKVIKRFDIHDDILDWPLTVFIFISKKTSVDSALRERFRYAGRFYTYSNIFGQADPKNLTFFLIENSKSKIYAK